MSEIFKADGNFKTCPFCGNRPELVRDYEGGNSFWIVACSLCLCSLVWKFKSIDEARAFWNNRKKRKKS